MWNGEFCHLSHFITNSSMTNTDGERDKGWDESGGGHLRAANIAFGNATCVCDLYMMHSSMGPF